MKEPPEPDWRDQLLETELGKMPLFAKAVQDLAVSQAAFQELPSVLKQAGVKPEDPLTVGVFVEVATRIGAQAAAERQLILASIFGIVQYLLARLAAGEVSAKEGQEEHGES